MLVSIHRSATTSALGACVVVCPIMRVPPTVEAGDPASMCEHVLCTRPTCSTGRGSSTMERPRVLATHQPRYARDYVLLVSAAQP